MSDAPVSPNPGTSAAFKQRHEAYALTRDGPDAVREASQALDGGYARAAADRMGGWLDRVAGNPVARRMIDARSPGLIDEARSWHAAAHAEARWEVRSTSRGQWNTSMDGRTETRLSFGTSEAGHHYRLEVSTCNSEREGGWSAAFRSEKAAMAAGIAAEDRASGDGAPRPRDAVKRTPRGRHAELLDDAAGNRRAASRLAGGPSAAPEVVARFKEVAREKVARASVVREFGMGTPDGAAPIPERRPARQPSRGIER